MPLSHRRRGHAGSWPGWGLTLVAGSLLAAGAPAACGASAPQRASSSGVAATAGYPVTVSDCGQSVTFDQAPIRAVSNDINTTEDMLGLGLGAHMVGDFGVNGDGPAGRPVPDEYLASFRQVPDVSSDYFTLEQLVGLHPDFLFAGWNYGLQVGTTRTPDNLAGYGIRTLALAESCPSAQSSTQDVSIDDTYQDLTTLGMIFAVAPKARQVIAGMQAQVAAAQAKVANLPPVSVFDYDSGQSAPVTGPGLAMPTALLHLGGGANIFAGLKKSWTSVSWEQVVAADPQCILINDYGTPTAAQKEQFLETDPVSKNLTAVKNHCFLALSYDEVTPGPRNAEAVAAIARWLHPAAFGLPPDGS